MSQESPNIYCQQCREPASPATLLCRKCGGRVVKHCPACGFVLSVAKKYCDSCGEPQPTDPTKSGAAPSKTTPQPPKGPSKEDMRREAQLSEDQRRQEQRKEELRREEELHREEIRKEEQHREELRKEEQRRKELFREELHKEELRREELQKEELRKEGLRRDERRREEILREEERRAERRKVEPPRDEPAGGLSLDPTSRKPSDDNPWLTQIPHPHHSDKDADAHPQPDLSLKHPTPPPEGKDRNAELEKYIPKTMISHMDRAELPLKERPKEPQKKVEPPRGPEAHAPKEPPPGHPEARRESAREKFERELAERQREKVRSKERPREPLRTLPRSSFTETMVQTIRQPKAVFSTSLALFLIASGCLVYFYRRHSLRTPQRTLMDTAGRYLFSLKEKNFGAAYSLLSSKSRLTCKLEEFQKLQQNPDWMFDAVEISSLGKDRALVRYKLHVSEKPTEEDWLEFVHEEGGWRRAYWWHLAEPIENDLAAKDFTKARARAEAGLEIVPDEPLLHSYLCEAHYGQEDYPGAERECLLALETGKRRPSRLADTDILHINAILADTYRSMPEKLPQAARYYELLLSFRPLPDAQRCDVQLALADTHYLAGEYSKSREDYEEAGRSCSQAEDLAYVKRSVGVLAGQAGAEAVATAKKSRISDPTNPGKDITLLEWRHQARKELAQRLRLPSDQDSDEETWTPAHVAGAAYRVSVRNQGTDILTAQVDLWNRTTEVKIHVQ